MRLHRTHEVSTMVHEAPPIDVGAIPQLAALVQEVARTRRPRSIQQHGKIVARLVPAAQTVRQRQRRLLVDTSALPPIPYRSVAELVRDRPASPTPSFSDEELKEAIAEARAEAWRTKQR